MAEKQIDFTTELALLKRDLSVFDKYFNKIDTTLEKLGEATSQITRIISLHDERIQNSQREDAELKTLIETRHTEAIKGITLLEEKTEKNYHELVLSLGNLEDNLTKKILESGKEANSRIQKLELWRYLVIGGAIATMFFVGQVYNSYVNSKVDPQQIQIQQIQPQKQAPEVIQMQQAPVQTKKK